MTRAMFQLPCVLVTLAMPGIALSQGSFAVPDGCTGKLTVQQKNCVMINVWTCDADDPGDQWVTLITQNGVFSMQKVDDEFQWLESYKVIGNERLLPPATDPASLTELFETQIDTWDFTLQTDDGIERNVGFDMLTGETTVIDGEVLMNTEYQGRSLDGNGVVTYDGAGRQFVSETHRLFFYGQSWTAENPDEITDMTPVEFIYPDEPGFFATQPKYECNVIESRYHP